MRVVGHAIQDIYLSSLRCWCHRTPHSCYTTTAVDPFYIDLRRAMEEIIMSVGHIGYHLYNVCMCILLFIDVVKRSCLL